MLKGRLKHQLALATYSASHRLPLVSKLLRRRGLVVLCYHSITRHSLDSFRRQLDFLVSTHPVVSALAVRTRFEACPEVAITFDDALASYLEFAMPELLARKLCSTVFVPTHCLGLQPNWNQEREPVLAQDPVMSADELKALASHPLITLGSHSCTHPNFRRLDSSAMEHEFRASKAALDTLCSQDTRAFSFPYGAYTSAAITAANKAGYTHLFSTEPSIETSPYPPRLIGRTNVDPGETADSFRLKASGSLRCEGALLHLKRALFGFSQ